LFNEKNDITIGKVLSPHGIGGMLKVFPYSDFPERVTLLKEVELILEGKRWSVAVEKASVYGRFWLIKFQGIETREDAAALNGSQVIIPRQNRMPLPEEHFYHDQLVGLQVFHADGRLIGQIVDIINTGGHDVLQVELTGMEHKKALIPAVKKFIVRVDLAAAKMVVELPEGLLEL
jgi:16S rRNA processing protein RimM